MLNRLRSEDGVVAVLVAILLPLLLAFSGYGLGLLLVAGGERELQRATDAAALAGAASLPLADLDYDYSADAAVREAVCEVLEANLEVAQIANGFGAGAVPDCDNGQVGISRENELADLQAIQNVVATVQGQLETHLRNVAFDTTCKRLADQIAARQSLLGGILAGTVGQLLGALVPIVDDVLVELVGDDPTLGPLVSRLSAEITDQFREPVLGLLGVVLGYRINTTALRNACRDNFRLPVDLRDVLPALVTPQVRVSVQNDLSTPLGDLLGQGTTELAATSLARRRLKNVVLLPALDSCKALAAAAGYTGILQTDVSVLVNDKDLCHIDVNQELAAPVGDALTETLGELGSLLAPVDPGLGSAVDCIVGAFSQDLADVYDPPGGGHTPTAGDVVRTAAATDEDVVVLVVGTVGATAIPFLDMAVLPATQLLADGDLAGAGGSLLEASGVFRASLLDEARLHTVSACL